jgi:hypothetical protein
VRSSTRLGASCLAACVAVVAGSAPASAAPKPITGKLSKPGYTVVGLAADGTASVVEAGSGRFRLRPPATHVTLHLRAPDGEYAGPVVLAETKRASNEVTKANRQVRQAESRLRRARRTGTGLREATRRLRKARAELNKAKRLLRQSRNRATLGVRAGARLGRIGVRAGYAKLSEPLGKRWVDRSRFGRARREVPLGAGVFGRVSSRPSPGTVPGDLDLDGIPDRLDIDDDGDLIVDSLDTSSGARAAQSPPGTLNPISSLELSLPDTVNANHPALAGKIEEGILGTLVLAQNPAVATELDCGKDDPGTATREGLVWCSTGDPPSKGLIFRSQGSPAETFPQPCCDSDEDGYGRLFFTPTQTVPMGSAFTLHFTATTAEIHSGQFLFSHITSTGDESQCPPPADTTNLNCSPPLVDTLQYIFATVPALVSYDDGAGNARPVPYPVPRGCPPPGPCSGFGTMEHPFPIKARDGRVMLTLTFWRPQRRPILPNPETRLGGDACAKDNPPCEWIDFGGLVYDASPLVQGNIGGSPCPQSAYSVPDGQPLSVLPPSGMGPGFGFSGVKDAHLDQPAYPDHTLTYILDLTACTGALNPRQKVQVKFQAAGSRTAGSSSPGFASQLDVFFELQP